MGIVYLDNAATSWPKPPVMLEAITRFVNEVGANPGRSGHRLSVESERIRYETREAIAKVFNIEDPLRVAFALNATQGLNIAIFGLLQPGDHVVTTSMEHNSVMRPLRALEKRGVAVTVVRCDETGSLNVGDVERAIRPEDTRLVVMMHASNVCGTIMPVRDVGELTRSVGIPLLVDAAQTAGCYPIDIVEDNIDVLAFTGHKGLLGPAGTGGLVFNPDFDIDRIGSLMHGGTGSRSDTQFQPDFLPDKFESGTCNAVGLAGLGASVRWILNGGGVEKIRNHESGLAGKLISGLSAIEGVRVYGTGNPELQTAAVSFALDGVSLSDVGQRLNEEYEIMCRVGLHCSPAGHETLGTYPGGTVRLAVGPFNTEEEIDSAVEAVAKIAGGR
ncbi:MAG: aminotransferase class V-fold PLP-dependent enzyme [Planctomycetota bacterium]|jgi:cysteine desulfurase family protein